MATRKRPRSDVPKIPPKIQIHYIKSNSFRTISGQGIVGGPTPQGKLFFAIFSERVAIPTSMTHEVIPTGELGMVLEQQSRGGVVREMDVGVVMDLDIAVRTRDWLAEQITKLEVVTKTREALNRVRKSSNRQ